MQGRRFQTLAAQHLQRVRNRELTYRENYMAV
jgi:hypothetical protein